MAYNKFPVDRSRMFRGENLNGRQYTERITLTLAQRQELGKLDQSFDLRGDAQNGGFKAVRIGSLDILTSEYDAFGATDPNKGTATAGSAGTTPPHQDWECCDSLNADYFPWMAPGESQIMVAHPVLTGCAYLWEVVDCSPNKYGCGALSAVGAGTRGIRYTAPFFEGCGSSVNVKLKLSVIASGDYQRIAGSDGGVGSSFDGVRSCSEEFNILVEAEECKCHACKGSILYTTLSMTFGEKQSLTVENACNQCTYRWEIASGGGSLSGTEGPTVVYTAPSTNASCANNPTIKLFCTPECYATEYEMDDVSIAITTPDYSNYRAGFICYWSEVSCECGAACPGPWCCHAAISCYKDAVQCDGDQTHSAGHPAMDGYGYGCSDAILNAQKACRSYPYNLNCEPGGGDYTTWDYFWYDYSPAYIEEIGCCPPQGL